MPFLRDKGREAAGVHSSGEEVSISKVSANYTYPNVFRLRRHKFEIMRQIFEAVPRNVKFVQLKELERSPELFIQSLVSEFNLTVKDGYEPQSPSKVVHTTGESPPLLRSGSFAPSFLILWKFSYPRPLLSSVNSLPHPDGMGLGAEQDRLEDRGPIRIQSIRMSYVPWLREE